MSNASEFPYPFPLRALKKWSQNNLRKEIKPTGEVLYQFLYKGSTCNNGGVPFQAFLKVMLPDESDKGIIQKAWIDIEADQREGAAQMCVVPGKKLENAGPFFDELASDADCVGRKLESVIQEEVKENFAGCFCTKVHLNQKWKMVLSTIHYSINHHD